MDFSLPPPYNFQRQFMTLVTRLLATIKVEHKTNPKVYSTVFSNISNLEHYAYIEGLSKTCNTIQSEILRLQSKAQAQAQAQVEAEAEAKSIMTNFFEEHPDHVIVAGDTIIHYWTNWEDFKFIISALSIEPSEFLLKIKKFDPKKIKIKYIQKKSSLKQIVGTHSKQTSALKSFKNSGKNHLKCPILQTLIPNFIKELTLYYFGENTVQNSDDGEYNSSPSIQKSRPNDEISFDDLTWKLHFDSNESYVLNNKLNERMAKMLAQCYFFPHIKSDLKSTNVALLEPTKDSFELLRSNSNFISINKYSFQFIFVSYLHETLRSKNSPDDWSLTVWIQQPNRLVPKPCIKTESIFSLGQYRLATSFTDFIIGVSNHAYMLFQFKHTNPARVKHMDEELITLFNSAKYYLILRLINANESKKLEICPKHIYASMLCLDDITRKLFLTVYKIEILNFDQWKDKSFTSTSEEDFMACTYQRVFTTEDFEAEQSKFQALFLDKELDWPEIPTDIDNSLSVHAALTENKNGDRSFSEFKRFVPRLGQDLTLAQIKAQEQSSSSKGDAED